MYSFTAFGIDHANTFTQESSNKPVPIMLCGNKIDLRSIASSKGMNVITTDQGQRLAKVCWKGIVL